MITESSESQSIVVHHRSDLASACPLSSPVKFKIFTWLIVCDLFNNLVSLVMRVISYLKGGRSLSIYIYDEIIFDL